MSAHEAEMVMMRERAERAEADLAFQKGLADQIPRIQKVAYEAEARVRELEGRLTKAREAWALYTRTTHGDSRMVAFDDLRAALTDTSEGEGKRRHPDDLSNL